MDITGDMVDLVAQIKLGTTRPVVADPRAVSNTPCVLVGMPSMSPPGTQCGTVTARWPVYVIGLPGALTELGPLSELLGEVLEVLPEWTACEPVSFWPLTAPATADPCQAYKVTAETMIEL